MPITQMPIKSNAMSHCHWRCIILIIIVDVFFPPYRWCENFRFFLCMWCVSWADWSFEKRKTSSLYVWKWEEKKQTGNYIIIITKMSYLLKKIANNEYLVILAINIQIYFHIPYMYTGEKRESLTSTIQRKSERLKDIVHIIQITIYTQYSTIQE